MIELPIYFVNKRSRYGYRFTEMFSELVPIQAEATLEPVRYSTDIMLTFLDLSLRRNKEDSKEFEKMLSVTEIPVVCKSLILQIPHGNQTVS